jgi:hypothetical protein
MPSGKLPEDAAGGTDIPDPGLTDSLSPVLASHQLIYGGDVVLTRAGREPAYVISSYGEFVLARLAGHEPGSVG